MYKLFLLIQKIASILLLKLIPKKSARIRPDYLEDLQRKAHFLCKGTAGGNASSYPTGQLRWGASATQVTTGVAEWTADVA